MVNVNCLLSVLTSLCLTSGGQHHAICQSWHQYQNYIQYIACLSKAIVNVHLFDDPNNIPAGESVRHSTCSKSLETVNMSKMVNSCQTVAESFDAMSDGHDCVMHLMRYSLASYSLPETVTSYPLWLHTASTVLQQQQRPLGSAEPIHWIGG